MTLFWTLAVVLTLLALLFVIVPLLRTSGAAQEPAPGTLQADTGVATTGLATGVANGVAVYRSQLAELEADRANGALSQEQFDAAKLDLQRSLLEMAPTAAILSPVTIRSQRWTAGIVVLAVMPLFAFILYTEYGEGPRVLTPSPQTVVVEDTLDAATETELAIAVLHERIDANPDDPVGWALLGRVYFTMGRLPAAAQAYSRAVATGGDQDAEILVDYADVLATMRSGNLEGRPLDLIQRALRIDPDHVKGLWLAGTAAFRAGNYPVARDSWERLLRQFPPQSESWEIIRANLAEVEARIAGQL